MYRAIKTFQKRHPQKLKIPRYCTLLSFFHFNGMVKVNTKHILHFLCFCQIHLEGESYFPRKDLEVRPRSEAWPNNHHNSVLTSNPSDANIVSHEKCSALGYVFILYKHSHDRKMHNLRRCIDVYDHILPQQNYCVKQGMSNNVFFSEYPVWDAEFFLERLHLNTHWMFASSDIVIMALANI